MKRVLIVDDRKVNRRAFIDFLQGEGYRFAEAGNGAEALETARIERPDVVLVDLLMPEMDGFEFTRRLRCEPEPLRSTPVVFISSLYLIDEVLEVACACGVNHVLDARASLEEIRTTIRDAIAQRKPVERISSWDQFKWSLLLCHTRKLSEVIKGLAPILEGAPDPDLGLFGRREGEPEGPGSGSRRR